MALEEASFMDDTQAAELAETVWNRMMSAAGENQSWARAAFRENRLFAKQIRPAGV
jgi:hypothetical protein